MKSETHHWSLQKIVMAGGGKWVGVQTHMTEDEHDMVMFTSEKDPRTMLSLPDDEFFTVQAVQEKIRKTDKTRSEYVRVKRSSVVNVRAALETILEMVEHWENE